MTYGGSESEFGSVPRPDDAGVPNRPTQSTADDGFSPPTYHQMHIPEGAGMSRGPRPPSTPPRGTGDLTVTRAVWARSRYFTQLVTHKVIEASQADGARESGLTALIWNQVLSYGTDAMITVALAGTVFFSAPSEAQRGNVLLYLGMTVAPFAVVAPVIGPVLDRFQHIRRYVMALTAFGRALLAVVMALNFNDLYVLFPAALGSLVLSKAYAVIRAAAAPRLLPSGMSLVKANSRISIFGLAAALVLGGFVGVAIRVTGSYPVGLWITAIAFGVCGYYALTLPRIIDALPSSGRRTHRGGPDVSPDSDAGLAYETEQLSTEHIGTTRPLPGKPRRRAWPIAALAGLRRWSVRGYPPRAVLALQGESALRWLSGFLTLFMAFYIESVAHGFDAVLDLGAFGAATGVGNFLGTAAGSRMKLQRPEVIILICVAVSFAACVVTAVFFSLGVAILASLFAAITNSLAKLCLDASIQHDVLESARASGFARSETFLQLAWVIGAALALLLPSGHGGTGFIICAAVTGLVTVFMVLRRRAIAPSLAA